LLIYIPLILIVLLSFNGQTDRENINLNFIDPSVENYLLLFQDSQFINALINTLLLALVVTPSVLIISVLTCFGI
jgi:spermidine/putrescine transport system permease protein